MKAVSASKLCDYLVLWTRFLQLLPRKEEAMLTKVTGESGWPRGSVFPLQAASWFVIFITPQSIEPKSKATV